MNSGERKWQLKKQNEINKYADEIVRCAEIQN
jgi:hypothetical protein